MTSTPPSTITTTLHDDAQHEQNRRHMRSRYRRADADAPMPRKTTYIAKDMLRHDVCAAMRGARKTYRRVP